MEVIGYEIFSGDYNGKVWENVRVYVIEPAKKGEGFRSEFLTIKRDKLPNPLNLMLHSKIKNVYYDKYKKVSLIEFEI